MCLMQCKIDSKKVGFLRFKQLGNKYLITNETGMWCFLNPQEYSLFLSGKIESSCPDKYRELQDKGFIRNYLDFDKLYEQYRKKNALAAGPCLHIVVVTLRCDHKCLYCQTSSKHISTAGLDMDIVTAKQVVDRIFESPNKTITIEFQGGEPLLNFDIVKFIVEYAWKKNKKEKKNLLISLVSNMSFMTEDKLKFFFDKEVGLCTSLDGPEMVHNRNRIAAGKKNSYQTAVRWIKEVQRQASQHQKYKYGINALTTITKTSLPYPKEIVDEFVSLGLEGVHLRPVNPFCVSRERWKTMRFSVDDFLKFYKIALDYIIDLNRKGFKIYERTARIFLTKILTDSDPHYLDIRSPCGAGIGQVAYNFNGDVYTCDEGRMLAANGDPSFCIGNVSQDGYREFINSTPTKTLVSASILDVLPGCSDCVYKPYCGVCPIYNYITEGDIFSKVTYNDRCRIHMAILDYLFTKINDPAVKPIFEEWVSSREANKNA